MRMLEIGIKSFAARLGIDDPVRPAERNWGFILRKIKGKIDDAYKAEQRMPGSEGAFMEALYATLDAVKNPWRNETMHVEGVYTDAEAAFILYNTIAFIQKMATGFDENGNFCMTYAGSGELHALDQISLFCPLCTRASIERLPDNFKISAKMDRHSNPVGGVFWLIAAPNTTTLSSFG